MKCQCIQFIKALLTEKHGLNANVCLELKQVIQVSDATVDLGLSLPPLYYTYREGKKRKRSFVPFNYCPFCGMRI